MKKILVVAVLMGLLVSGAYAGSTNVITNAVGQAVTVVVGDDGVITTSIVTPGLPSVEARNYVSLQGMQVDTNASTTVTLYTPRDIGDLLFGQIASTSYLWVATGYTTNSWRQFTLVP